MTTEAEFGVRLLQAEDGWKPSEAGRRRKASPLEADALVLNSWPPELGENQFLSSEAAKFAGICYGRPGMQTQRPGVAGGLRRPSCNCLFGASIHLGGFHTFQPNRSSRAVGAII